jgi:anti-anti-sigma regulatory factor
LLGQLGGLAAKPLRALLEPIASCGIGLTLDFGGVSAIDPIGLGVLIRLLACSGGSAILVTNAPPSVTAFVDRLLPDGQPGLLVLPAARLRVGAQPAAS